MNAVEHIVECYFRYVRGCFTMTDVKVPGGNNRQCDLLAYDLKKKKQYHIESSVTHQENWAPSTDQLKDIFDKKFRGVPAKRAGENTDYSKGKSYLDHILSTYQKVGLRPSAIKRVFVTWKNDKQSEMKRFLAQYYKTTKLRIEIISFRDEILPALMNTISTSNYDDEVLRTLSLIRQRELQNSKKRAK